MSITFGTAVERLRAAGAEKIADRLQAYRNADGGKGGWDGWLRGLGNSRLVAIVWPEEGRR